MDKREARRRQIRTFFQTFVAACAVVLAVVPGALAAMDDKLPPKLYGLLAAAAGAIVAVASLVTKVMAMPAVNRFIEKRLPWLAAGPEAGRTEL